MTARKKRLINRCGKLRSIGWKVDFNELNHITPHSGRETPRHWFVKCGICNILSNETRAFATEIHHPDRGTCDILDLNQDNSVSYIYEVETNCSRERAKEKAYQYTDNLSCDVIGDVFVIDPTDAPTELDALEAWLRDEIGGL